MEGGSWDGHLMVVGSIPIADIDLPKVQKILQAQWGCHKYIVDTYYRMKPVNDNKKHGWKPGGSGQ